MNFYRKIIAWFKNRGAVSEVVEGDVPSDTIYAQIKNEIVQNIIILNDEALLEKFCENFDELINVTDENPRPDIGWSYINGAFQPTGE